METRYLRELSDIVIDWLHHSPLQVEMCKKYHPDCLVGKHVPLKALDQDDTSIVLYVICQKCLRPMTIEQHKEFFEESCRYYRKVWKEESVKTRLERSLGCDVNRLVKKFSSS